MVFDDRISNASLTNVWNYEKSNKELIKSLCKPQLIEFSSDNHNVGNVSEKVQTNELEAN